MFKGSIIFDAKPPWVQVRGNEPAADGTFFATGVGTVAGFPNVPVQFKGTINPTSLDGEYTMGATWQNPVVYHVTGTKIVASPPLTEVTTPLALTVAIYVLLEDQVTVAVAVPVTLAVSV